MGDYNSGSFSYHASSSPVTDYQARHQPDKQAAPVVISSGAHHWPHYPGGCQCFVAAPPHPQPAMGFYGYVDQWGHHHISSSAPLVQPARAYPQQVHPGPIYPRNPGYPQHYPSLESVPPCPAQGVYRYPYSQGPSESHQYSKSELSHPRDNKSRPKNAQHQLGPPQHPLQSRFAIWVGGISANTSVLQLRDHFFAPEIARDIQSVLLSPGSHSGFVNFRTFKSCKTAVDIFNNSVLNNTYIRCRCRKPMDPDEPGSTVESASIPASPTSDMMPSPATESHCSLQMSDEETPISSDGSDSQGRAASPAKPDADNNNNNNNNNLPPKSARYFIIKSLTEDELIGSVNSGCWATQSQNEATLNAAYQSCDAVYLIFSQNRSGEFFGYARMASPITNDASTFPFAPPNSTATPAADMVPPGRVVDDLPRGRIFWELARDLWTPGETATMEALARSVAAFGVDWISTRKLPFWQTRHLTNAWNAGKPVKVGRDGTELETEAGRKLCELFLGPVGARARA